jgi:ABC-type phosphate/phosphonate transport system substrate-binding protein
MFGGTVLSGSHVASINAVVRGDADVAAIDDSVWSWLESRGQPQGLRVIDQTPEWPAPPLVFGSALSEPDAERVQTLLRRLEPGQVPGLDRFEPARRIDYAPMLAVAGMA